MTLHGQEINIGDEVFDLKYGEGEVYEILPEEGPLVLIQFKEFQTAFLEDGRESEGMLPTLHFPGATVIPGKKKVKVRDWVVFRRPKQVNVSPDAYVFLGMTREEVNKHPMSVAGYEVVALEGTEREVHA